MIIKENVFLHFLQQGFISVENGASDNIQHDYYLLRYNLKSMAVFLVGKTEEVF